MQDISASSFTPDLQNVVAEAAAQPPAPAILAIIPQNLLAKPPQNFSDAEVSEICAIFRQNRQVLQRMRDASGRKPQTTMPFREAPDGAIPVPVKKRRTTKNTDNAIELVTKKRTKKAELLSLLD